MKASFAEGAPPPDPAVAAQIGQQIQAGDKAEQEVATLAPAPAMVGAPAPAARAAAPAPAGPPVEVSVGQTVDQVSALMGNPTKVFDLGAKKVYVYKDMKITFSAGKVSNIE